MSALGLALQLAESPPRRDDFTTAALNLPPRLALTSRSRRVTAAASASFPMHF